MTLDTETIKRLAVESGVEQDGYYQSIDDSSAYTYKFTEPQLLAFANSIAKLTTELNELDDVFSVDKDDAEITNAMIVAVENEVQLQLYASGINQEMHRLDGQYICEKLFAAMKGE